MSYSSFGYAFPAAPIGGGSAGTQQLLHSSRLTSFATNSTGNSNNSSNNNNSNTISNSDNISLLQQSGHCRLQLQGSTGTMRPYGGGGLEGGTAPGAGGGGLYGHGLITYPRPVVHGGALTDSVYRSAYVAAAAAAHQGYGPLVAAVDSAAASGTVCYPTLNADGHETWRTVTQTPTGGWPYDFNMGVYPYTNSYGGLDVRRKNATRESTSTLKAWLYEHIKNPYPTKGEKIMLAIITKMTLTQVSTWFANARRRLKKENKMQWSPNKRSDEREGDDDDDNDDNDNDDDDEERMKLNVADDEVSQEPLQKLALLKAMQEARTHAESINQQNIFCVAPACVTSPTLHPHLPPHQPSSVTHQLASHLPQFPHPHSSSSSPASTNLSRVCLSSSRPPAKDDLEGPAKPRIWSLADVATRGIVRDQSKDVFATTYPTPSEQSVVVVESQSVIRPKFQPWAEDNHWAAAAAGEHPHHKPDDDLMLRRNQTPAAAPFPSPSSSAPLLLHHPHHPHGHPNIHWSIYRTLSTAAATAGPFSFSSSGHPVGIYVDKYNQPSTHHLHPINAPSIRDSTEDLDGNRSDAAGPPFPVSSAEDDGDAETEGGGGRGAEEDHEEDEATVGDGGSSSIEENCTALIPSSCTRINKIDDNDLQ